MRDKNIPYFAFYPKDLLVDTQAMPEHELGIYIRMLAHCWIQAGLPNDRVKLERLTRTVEAEPKPVDWDDLIGRFYVDDHGLLQHKRLDVEREKQLKRKQKAIDAAEKRWGCSKHTPSISQAIPKTCISVPSYQLSEGTPLNPPKGKFDPESIDLPSDLELVGFRRIWTDWCQHRREKRQALKQTTAERQIKKLAKMGASRAMTALNHSMEQGYTGIFEPSDNNKSQKKPGYRNREYDGKPEMIVTEHAGEIAKSRKLLAEKKAREAKRNAKDAI